MQIDRQMDRQIDTYSIRQVLSTPSTHRPRHDFFCQRLETPEEELTHMFQCRRRFFGTLKNFIKLSFFYLFLSLPEFFNIIFMQSNDKQRKESSSSDLDKEEVVAGRSIKNSHRIESILTYLIYSNLMYATLIYSILFQFILFLSNLIQTNLINSDLI